MVTHADRPYRLEFEDGVWVHRYPAGPRLVPSLDGHPLKDNLVHVARVWRAVEDLAQRFPLDLVAGNVWLAEALGCAVDPRWPTVMTLSTPLRTIASTSPAVAEKPEVAWQIKLENAALERADQLHSVSEANLRPFASTRRRPRRCRPRSCGTGSRTVPATMDPVRNTTASRSCSWVGSSPARESTRFSRPAVELLTRAPGSAPSGRGSRQSLRLRGPTAVCRAGRERLAQTPRCAAADHFEGEVSEPRSTELFARCDIFCAPSRYESFGLMNLEAMMFSRPVVSCRVGGIEEVVVSGETGILVDPDDADGLLDALRTLVDDPALRQRMGTAGRRRFEAEFSNESPCSEPWTCLGAPFNVRRHRTWAAGGRSRRCAG